MEIPPLRKPRIGQILVRSLLDRTLKIALRALYVAAPAGAILWILGYFNILADISRCLNLVGVFLGMNGVILTAFFLSLPANELLIPVILMTLTGAGTLQEIGTADAAQMLSALSRENLVCTMLFTLFHWPCATTILTIYKETDSYKKTAAAIILPTAVGVLVCAVLHFLFRYLG